MKRTPLLFFAGALMSTLCVGFVGCNEPKESKQQPTGNEIHAVPVSDEIAEFFDENLSLIARAIFEEDGNSELKDRCVMINGVDELPKVDSGGVPINYPDIDFESHTLVVGQYTAAHSGIYFASQNLDIEEYAMTICLTLGTIKGDVDYEQIVLPKYFWGMYPKINVNSIDMNVTYID